MNKEFKKNQKDYWEREDLTRRRSPEHPVIAAYVLPKINVIRRYVNLTEQTRLLDVGCGNGFFTFYFDKICDASGVDYSEKMLQMNPVKKTFLMEASDLKFEDNSFDVLFCHALLHHVEDIDKVVREMRRVSKKYVIILEPNRNNPLMFLFSLIVREERKALKFSLSYLREIARKNGLHIVTSFSYGMTVPNKTPASLLPLASLFNFKYPFGMTNFVIARVPQ
ncbi:MAG: class I SAM-dependent methyltransferase [Candidatus Euphemobacter frigidus]|nr:class I SAM-dependent methyltransferase [Candidatus Euphemobacter frigidus]